MVAARGARPQQSGQGNFGERFGFGIISMILAIPLSAIAVVQADLPGLIVAWAGIVGVNGVHASRGWPWLRGPREREGLTGRTTEPGGRAVRPLPQIEAPGPADGVRHEVGDVVGGQRPDRAELTGRLPGELRVPMYSHNSASLSPSRGTPATADELGHVATH